MRDVMKKTRIILLLLSAMLSFSCVADKFILKKDYPQTYTVVEGDTLWGISERFLQDAWHWSDLWEQNTQIKSPHMIYPGDVLTLIWVAGKPTLTIKKF